MNASYRCGARAYLGRAKSHLDSGTKDTLFYAAFELRCAIESRLQEYLDVQEEVSKKKKNGWKIAKLARDLESVFRVGDKVVQLVFTDSRSGRQMPVYFTPVSRSLQEKGERLGELLHAMRRAREDTDPWWTKTRSFLIDVLEETRLATAGTLLGPPMIKPEGKRFKLNIEAGVLPTQDDFFDSCWKVGFDFDMMVDYLPEVPEEYLAQFIQRS